MRTTPLLPLNRFASVLVLWTAMLIMVVMATPAFSDAESDQAQIEYRQTVMGGIGSNIGAISGILKNRLTLPGHVENHARQIAESAKLIGGAFKNNISEGATDAKIKIWSDWSGFEEAIAGLESAANALATAAASGDDAAVGPAVKALGKSCGGCHKAYRKPKEESYKSQ